MSLMIKTEEMATREEVGLVWTPAATSTYQPVPYSDYLDMLQTEVQSQGYTIIDEQYGLSSSARYQRVHPDGVGRGAQLFGYWVLEHKNGEQSEDGHLMLGIRSSHDKTLKAEVVGGKHITVCSNLMFIGSALEAQRKHTLNVWDDMRDLVQRGLKTATKAYVRINGDIEIWRSVPVNEDRGYEILGRALAWGYIKPQQVTIAIDAWRDNLNDHGRSLWGVYNALTEATKRGSVVTALDRHVKADDFVRLETALYRHDNPKWEATYVFSEPVVDAFGAVVRDEKGKIVKLDSYSVPVDGLEID